MGTYLKGLREFDAQQDQGQKSHLRGLREFESGQQAKAPAEVQGNMEWRHVVRNAIKNIPSSTWQMATDTMEGLAHPIESLKAIGNIARGGVQKLYPGEQPSEKMFDMVVDNFKNSYGSIENFKRYLSESPMQILGDAASIVSGAGGAMAATGKVARLSKLQQVGKTVQRAGAAMEPGQIAKRGIRKALPAELLYQSAAKFSTVAQKPGELSKDVRLRMTQTALENSIMPTYRGLDDLTDQINILEADIDELVKAPTRSGVRLDAGEMSKYFPDVYEMAEFMPERSKFKRQIRTIENEHIKKYGIFDDEGNQTGWQTMTPADVQTSKKTIYRMLRGYYDKVKTQPLKVDAQKQMARAAKEMLEQIIPEIKYLNKRDGALRELQLALDRASGRIENHDVSGLSMAVKIGTATGAGAAMGDVTGLGTALGIAWGLLDHPKVKAKIALVAHKLKKKGVQIAPEKIMILGTKFVPPEWSQYLKPGLSSPQAAVGLGAFQGGRAQQLQEGE